MENFEYKGFQGSVRFYAEDRTFHGRLLGVDDVVSFEGSSVDELEAAFHEAVDDYMELCRKLGREPERRYSGRVALRIDPDLHRRVAIAAAADKISVNSWIARALERSTSEDPARRAMHGPTSEKSARQRLEDALEVLGVKVAHGSKRASLLKGKVKRRRRRRAKSA